MIEIRAHARWVRHGVREAGTLGPTFWHNGYLSVSVLVDRNEESRGLALWVCIHCVSFIQLFCLTRQSANSGRNQFYNKHGVVLSSVE